MVQCFNNLEKDLSKDQVNLSDYIIFKMGYNYGHSNEDVFKRLKRYLNDPNDYKYMSDFFCKSDEIIKLAEQKFDSVMSQKDLINSLAAKNLFLEKVTFIFNRYQKMYFSFYKDTIEKEKEACEAVNFRKNSISKYKVHLEAYRRIASNNFESKSFGQEIVHPDIAVINDKIQFYKNCILLKDSFSKFSEDEADLISDFLSCHSSFEEFEKFIVDQKK